MREWSVGHAWWTNGIATDRPPLRHVELSTDPRERAAPVRRRARTGIHGMSLLTLSLLPSTTPRVAFAPRRGARLTASASRKRRKNKEGGSIAPAETETETATASESPPASTVVDDDAPGTSAAAAAAAAEPLPAVTREAVLDSCYGTTFWMLAIGVTAREATHFARDALPSAVSDWTADLPLVAGLHPPFGPEDIASHFAVAVAAAAAVTAARAALLRAWPDFARAADRSNRQVLTPLNRGDVVTVSFLPAVAEEALFRGALLPALGCGPVGVAATGAAFGALHVGGGRNWAFAGWAAGVGCLYGAAAVQTGDVAVAMLAHGLANYASAAMWLEGDKGN